ncbi:hypothetical protein GJ744_002956 [Endocarpon pusillum]|uniref:Cytochrome P450 n=1 Tax=Endocarpon pusillum TaxID=364733 RepID=A0A8H7DZN5_9EURO|nr:hypothetical protein GJ744_002956 [Endocarpon pusillum]
MELPCRISQVERCLAALSSRGPFLTSLDEEYLVTPQNGSIAWSEGNRSCPGKKFSQVEFVASMAGLFRDRRVDPVPEESENLEMARGRIVRMVEEDTGQVLLLQILHPERAPLAWRQRLRSQSMVAELES